MLNGYHHTSYFSFLSIPCFNTIFIRKNGFIRKNVRKQICEKQICEKQICSLHKSIIPQELLYQNFLDILKLTDPLKFFDLQTNSNKYNLIHKAKSQNLASECLWLTLWDVGTAPATQTWFCCALSRPFSDTATLSPPALDALFFGNLQFLSAWKSQRPYN